MKETHVSSIVSIPSDNTSRVLTSPKDLFTQKDLESLASDLYPGWNADLGVVIAYRPFDEKDSAGKITLSGEDKMVQARESLREYFEEWPFEGQLKVRDGEGQIISVAQAHCLDSFDRMFKGKKAATHAANTCNRRLVALVVANAAKLVAGDPNLILEVPMVIEDYSSELQRRIANVRSNAGIDKSRKKQTDRDLLRAAFDILNANGTESNLHKGGNSCRMTRYNAQKMTAIIRLNGEFPELEIVDRCLNPDRDDAIKLSSLDKEKMRYLLNGKKEGDVVIIEKGTKEQVEEYFLNPGANKQNEERIMSKKTMDNIIQINPNKVVKMVVFAIRHNEPDNLGLLAKHSKEFNALLDKLEGGE